MLRRRLVDQLVTLDGVLAVAIVEIEHVQRRAARLVRAVEQAIVVRSRW